MSTKTLLNYLLDDSTPATPAHFAHAQLLLGKGGPPAHLVTSTLAAMDDEVVNYQKALPIALFERKRRTPRFWISGVVALAAVMLLQIDVGDIETTQPATQIESTHTESMIPKGVEATAPEVSLELAVLSGGANLERFSSEQAYGSGDAVFFRAGVHSNANVALFHIENGEVTTLLETALAQGETDLSVDNSPAQWQFETGDEDAIFLLVSLQDDTSTEQVTQTIIDTLRGGGGELCESLRMIGCQCDQRAVMVSTE